MPTSVEWGKNLEFSSSDQVVLLLSPGEGKKCNLWKTVSFVAKLKKVKKKRRRDEELSSEESPRRHHHQTKVFAKFSHDAPPPGIKKKHLSIEQLNARRRKVWLSIVKKELPKVSECLQCRRWRGYFFCLLSKEELGELDTFTLQKGN